jgi:hypothetical protein
LKFGSGRAGTAIQKAIFISEKYIGFGLALRAAGEGRNILPEVIALGNFSLPQVLPRKNNRRRWPNPAAALM